MVTPFDASGDIDHDALAELVDWVEARGVDFIVPCGSNGEAELLTGAERRAVVETVVDAASVPVLAGTGHPGLRETLEATESAADAGADAALVVTPFYYDYDQGALEAYYREVADESPLPVYLYSVPAYTGVRLDPETVGALADHPNVAGMKDSHAALGEFTWTQERIADSEFDLMIGSASVLAAALDAGATGGVVALANLLPEETAEVYRRHAADPEAARRLNAELVEVNTAITATYGVPGLKYAMRQRGAPAGSPRSPHRPPDEAAEAHLRELLAAVE